jgi:CubicO group peptidase (beta-lactamase class C family)
MTSTHSRFALTFCLAPFLCAAQSSPVPMNASREAQLQKQIPELMERADVPGLSVAVIRSGKTVWTGAFGVRDKASNLPVDRETMFNVGSLSKPVFAYAVLKLVDSGRLKLDESLAPYLSKDLIIDDPRFQKITARIVLTHRTGFPNWPPDGKPLVIHFTPGEKFSYSGAGMVLLQRAVEKITGQPLNDYIQQSVFTPLGMKHSSYISNPVFTDVAIGYSAAGEPRDNKFNGANAAASLATTAEDYATFLNAILRRKGLKPSTFRDLENPEIAVDTGCANCVDGTPTGTLSTSIFWGLGFGIEKTSDGLSLWHWGDNGIFKAFFVVRPASRSGVVYMTNGENGLALSRPILAETLGGDQPAFDWLHYDNYDSPGLMFTKTALQQGANAALTQFAKELASGTISEGSLNQLGYSLMGKKKIDDAILIFEKNTELHPTSWNAYDSLGEAYLNKGDNQQAVKNYRKSVELNPSSESGRAALKKLGSE